MFMLDASRPPAAMTTLSGAEHCRPQYPSLHEDLLIDAACVALNTLQPHFIRHGLDLNFHMPDAQRAHLQSAIHSRAIKMDRVAPKCP
jgi:hypothetical protein